MLLHFTLAGIALFMGALVLVGLVYSDLIENRSERRVADRQSRRHLRARYADQTRVAVALALLSLIPFRAVRHLGQRRRSGIGLARLTGLMLLAGFPASFIVWRMVANLPDSPGDMTTVQQVINDVSWAVLILAGLLLLQSLLAVWYQVWLSLPGVQRQLGIDDIPANPLLARLRGDRDRVVAGGDDRVGRDARRADRLAVRNPRAETGSRRTAVRDVV